MLKIMTAFDDAAIRFLDILISFIVIFALIPLLLSVCIWNLLTGENEIFYKQIRVGKDGKHFHILKFATMIKDSPNIGSGLFTDESDTRFLPLGAVLRKTKINELPQLINVIRGEMSIVGFRPLVPTSYDTVKQMVGERAYTCASGITSVASILLRNEEAILSKIEREERIHYYNTKILPAKACLDLWWCENRNLYNYCLIIALTAVALILPIKLVPFGVLKDLPLLSL